MLTFAMARMELGSTMLDSKPHTEVQKLRSSQMKLKITAESRLKKGAVEDKASASASPPGCAGQQLEDRLIWVPSLSVHGGESCRNPRWLVIVCLQTGSRDQLSPSVLLIQPTVPSGGTVPPTSRVVFLTQFTSLKLQETPRAVCPQ